MYVDYELQTQIIEGLDLGIIFFHAYSFEM